MAIQLHITPTGKGYHPDSDWQHLSERPEIVEVEDVKAAQAYIRDRYGKAKRQPMYRDTASGTVKCGYVVGFRNADWSHSPVEHWLQQDWIELREVQPIATLA
jgi:hypothetical protein